jgi:ABC-2 type transport system ATP-binding protein
MSELSEAAVIETHALTKAYDRNVAVDQLELQVMRGEVFGFLGPNGAGKTTTIRMLLGLIRPTAGTALILGSDVHAAATRVLPRVGALIEAPALYGWLSGRDNLKCVADILGGVQPGRIDEMLELVDLRDRQHDRVGSYSLGMKQRLGIAVALIHDPDLVILDEPTNGLDPAGIVEIRQLLRHLAESGKTVFVSSHILAEVQEVTDRVAILSKGRLIRVGAVEDLLGGSGEFELRIGDPAGALRLLRNQEWGASARLEDGLLIAASPTGEGRDLIQFLVQNGFPPDGLAERRASLESIFLELTGDVN